MKKIKFTKPRGHEKVPLKAYKNPGFLGGKDARPIRILSEFLEPLSRFRYFGIKDTIVFFGSARIKSKSESLTRLKKLNSKYRVLKRHSKKNSQELRNAETDVVFSRYYEDAVELARLLTLWSKSLSEPNRFVVCTGGGPGIMEAANRGASIAKGMSIGLNISLPFEQYPNPYITDILNFQFHYFFMRKYWFMYLGKALIAFPGGFGTMDELMELLTLLQTQKIRKKMSVILYGEEYWKEIINFDKLLEYGMISKSDMSLFQFANTPKEAFGLLKKDMQRLYPMNKD